MKKKKDIKKKKREAMTWHDNCKFEENAIVILFKALNNPKWFNGRIVFDISITSFSKNPADYVAAKKIYKFQNKLPKGILLSGKYKDEKILVEAKWNSERQPPRYDIALIKPETIKYFFPDVYGRPKLYASRYCGSRYLEAAVQKVQEAVKHGIEAIDGVIASEAAEKQEEQETKDEATLLEETLGVKINVSSQGTFIYGMNRAFGMRFSRGEEKDGIVLYDIERIRGDFSQKELKEIIRVIGGSPRAIAARLTQGKGRGDDYEE